MRESVRNIQCAIPLSDFDVFKRFADGMGWSFCTIQNEKAKEKEKVKMKLSDIEYIKSLHATGGRPVPADENP